MNPVTLDINCMYRLRTKIGQQKLEREHRLTFIGITDVYGIIELYFSARPKEGTQKFVWGDIVSITHITDPGEGRLRLEHYVNKVVRPEQV